MSLLKANSVQIGQSSTATQNFTLAVPSSPDGTIKLARGNSGSTTADIFSVDASGTITGATISGATISSPTISGATINSSTINGGSITLGTSVASTSGTSIDFTGIPSWAKRITVMFDSVSTNGSSIVCVRIGHSGGGGTIISTAYGGTAQDATTSQQLSTSILLGVDGNASYQRSGTLVITLLKAQLYSFIGIIGHTSDTRVPRVAGQVGYTRSEIDRIRVTTVNGTDTFDAGNINIMYEG